MTMKMKKMVKKNNNWRHQLMALILCAISLGLPLQTANGQEATTEAAPKAWTFGGILGLNANNLLTNNFIFYEKDSYNAIDERDCAERNGSIACLPCRRQVHDGRPDDEQT